MDADDYQKLANRTLLDSPDFVITDYEVMVLWNAAGLAGEVGELVDHIKKGIFHQRGLNVEHIQRELGDVLWYIAGLCKIFDLPMSQVMEINIQKLRARYPDGYSADRSAVRDGEAR